jgi:hypothetical protein
MSDFYQTIVLLAFQWDVKGNVGKVVSEITYTNREYMLATTIVTSRQVLKNEISQYS